MRGRSVRWGGIVAFVGVLIAGSSTGIRKTAAQSSWADQDIGSPAIAGSATTTASGVTIVAAGSDVWGTSDQFHFVYQPVTGDVDVRARVDSVSYASAWSKAGVMIRGSLAAGAAHGFALVSAGKGTAFQRRKQAGGSSTNTSGVNTAPPEWVRLVRHGTTLTAYTSSNGSSWSLIGSDTIQLGATAYVGLAATSHSASASTTAALSQISVTPLGLPAGQADSDIGSPAIAGSASYASGTYQIHAGGTDIWGTADQFHFVYQQVSGDVDLRARVDSIRNSSSWAKAGVMIRNQLNAGSPHAYALLSAGNGYSFQRRPLAGGTSVSTTGSAGAAPGWVRLTRSGDLFTAYQSSDGQNWTVIGSDSIAMADTVYVGLAVTSHNATSATDVVADAFSVTQQATGNQPPAVSITSPANGATFTAPASIAIAASASDPENQLTKVELYSGTTLLGTDTAAPYSFSWSSVPAGSYSLTAVAYDAGGLSTRSAAVSVSVGTANRPPTVSITSPVGGTTFAAPASIAIAATAADPENQLTKVQFYSGTTLLGTDTAAPYSFTWSSVPAGSYSLTAVAYDAGGLSTRSAAVSVTVGTATTAPTGVAFTASADDATVTSYRLDVFAATADPNTATPIASMDGGHPTPDATNTITISAASFFSALAAGNYQLTVSAINASGAGRSAPIAFTR